MEVIDFHTHIYPEKIADKATKSVCDFYHLQAYERGTVNNLLESGRAAGIARHVVLPVAVKPEHVESINHFVAGEAAKHPEIIGFGAIHAAMEQPMDAVRQMEELGFKGLKIHPETQGFNIDDERLFEVYDCLQGGPVVLFHCGDAHRDYSHPRRVKRLLQLFPRLTVVAAHFGGWQVYNTGFEVLRDVKCYMDISSAMMYMSDAQIVRFMYGLGPERLLFGSDFPLWNPAEELAHLMRLPLLPEEKEMIAGGNACRLLGL